VDIVISHKPECGMSSNARQLFEDAGDPSRRHRPSGVSLKTESVQMLWGERRGLWHLRRC